MEGFIIEEFKSYKVFIHCCEYTDNCLYQIVLKLNDGEVQLKFVEGDLKKNSLKVEGNKTYYNIYYHGHRYSDVIDLLRNEKPLFFYFNYETKHSYITTSDEPVGEGE